ncbi:hypothetical protein RUND412_006694 [Rhizina undulata]
MMAVLLKPLEWFSKIPEMAFKSLSLARSCELKTLVLIHPEELTIDGGCSSLNGPGEQPKVASLRAGTPEPRFTLHANTDFLLASKTGACRGGWIDELGPDMSAQRE